MNKTKTILKNSLKEMKTILPLFFIAIILGVLIELYIPNSLVTSLIGKNVFIAIPIATLIGIILPIPRYATYPIAASLLLKGAGFGVIFALVAGEVITESFAREYLSIKYFGIKFFSIRTILTAIFITLGAFLIEVLL
jgi:uncharacterized membrane protein YraQ (UPF0718 family)